MKVNDTGHWFWMLAIVSAFQWTPMGMIFALANKAKNGVAPQNMFSLLRLSSMTNFGWFEDLTFSDKAVLPGPIVEFGILGHLRIWRLANLGRVFLGFYPTGFFFQAFKCSNTHHFAFHVFQRCDLWLVQQDPNRIRSCLPRIKPPFQRVFESDEFDTFSRKGFLAQRCRLSQWSWKLSKVLRRNHMFWFRNLALF